MTTHTAHADAKPYAKALWNLSSTPKEFERWEAWLKSLSHVTQHPSVVKLLVSPKAKSQALKKMIQSALPGMTEQETKMLTILHQSKRLTNVPAILDHYQALALEAQSVLSAMITTACKLKASDIKKISAKLTAQFGQKVQCTQEISPELLAGFVININNVIYDYSIDGQLRQLVHTDVER